MTSNVPPPGTSASPVTCGPAVRHPQLQRPPSREQLANANHVVFVAGQADPIVSTPAYQKSLVDAYLLAIPLGFLGLHHFYLKRPAFGVLYVFTLGLLGYGWILDWFRLPCLVSSYNQAQQQRTPGKVEPERKNYSDAFFLWLSPFGLLGFHHYYLKRYVWGVAYTLTLGFLGIGWLFDAPRIFSLVDEANQRIEENFEDHGVPQKSIVDAYVLGVAPCGIIGAHHYYLGRYKWGLLYTFTLGLAGCGWLFDWFRIKFLVERANARLRQENAFPRKYYDDAYVLWFPFGLLGLHHFYLKRYVWGIVYLCTLGMFGIGWLMDLVRIPYLIRDVNKHLASITIVTCIIPPNGQQPIITRHPAGDVRVSVPGHRERVLGQPRRVRRPAEPAEPVCPSGVILQPPAYDDSQPPSYDSIAGSQAESHDNQGYVTEGDKEEQD